MRPSSAKLDAQILAAALELGWRRMRLARDFARLSRAYFVLANEAFDTASDAARLLASELKVTDEIDRLEPGIWAALERRDGEAA